MTTPMTRYALACLFCIASMHVHADVQMRGDAGVLFVHGLLLETPCRLEMNSPRQVVNLHQGKTPFELILTECPEQPLTISELETAPYLRGKINPVYTASFISGIGDIGLRLLDNRGVEIPLVNGKADVPLYAGQSAFRYAIDASYELELAKKVHGLATFALDYR